jgi:transposase
VPTAIYSDPYGRTVSMTAPRAQVDRTVQQDQAIRRVATRYDKLAANYLAFINLINMHLAAC